MPLRVACAFLDQGRVVTFSRPDTRVRYSERATVFGKSTVETNGEIGEDLLRLPSSISPRRRPVKDAVELVIDQQPFPFSCSLSGTR